MTEPEQSSPRARIDEFLARFGKERQVELEPLSDDGRAKVQRGAAVVWIHVLEEQGVLLLVSRLMPVPPEGGPVDREAVFRRLLELSFLATRDAAFAINKATDEIFLRCLRPLDGLDYEEFEDMVHTIASLADEWDERLRRELA
jgi:hypothetical protein